MSLKLTIEIVYFKIDVDFRVHHILVVALSYSCFKRKARTDPDTPLHLHVNSSIFPLRSRTRAARCSRPTNHSTDYNTDTIAEGINCMTKIRQDRKIAQYVNFV